MKFIGISKIVKKKGGSGRFSDFFLHASDRKKHKVLKEVAKRSNEDQQKVFAKSKLKTKIS